MVSVLDYGLSCPCSSPGQGHCTVFLGKTLYSHSASQQNCWDFKSTLDFFCRITVFTCLNAMVLFKFLVFQLWWLFEGNELLNKS